MTNEKHKDNEGASADEMAALPQTLAQLQQDNASLREEQALLHQTIAELTQAKEQAEQERDRYKYVLMHIPAGILIARGRDHLVELANPAYLETTGRDDAILNQAVRQIFPNLAAQGRFTRMDEVYRTGKPFVAKDYPVLFDLDGNGKVVATYYDFMYHPILAKSGEIEGVFIRLLDVSDEVRTRQTLELERARLQQIFTKAPAAITTVHGPDYVFGLANELYLRLVGRTASIIGKRVLEALPEVAGQGFIELLDGVRESGTPFIGQEIPIELDRQGKGILERAYLNFVYQPIFDSLPATPATTDSINSNGEGDDGGGKTVEGIFVHIIDVTEQVEARHHIEELSLLKDEFIAVASHDLRTPITSLKGYIQLLERSLLRYRQTQKAVIASATPNERENQFIDNSLQIVAKVLNQTNRLHELINRLLDFSQLSEGQLSLQYNEKVDLIPLVQEVVAAISQSSEEHQILMQPPVQDSIVISCDTLRLEQVLNNLLTNALKYSPAHTTVTVGLQTNPFLSYQRSEQGEAAEVVLWVKDEGYGIVPEQQAHLFERFYRVQNEKTASKAGLGLGLYITAEIVKQHGGRLWVESEVGKGSTFYVALPIWWQHRERDV